MKQKKTRPTAAHLAATSLHVGQFFSPVNDRGVSQAVLTGRAQGLTLNFSQLEDHAASPLPAA